MTQCIAKAAKAAIIYAGLIMSCVPTVTLAQTSKLTWTLQFTIWAATGPIPGNYRGQVAYIEFAPYSQIQCEQLGKELLKKYYSPQKLRATYNCNPND